jgi:hypothetical protein
MIGKDDGHSIEALNIEKQLSQAMERDVDNTGIDRLREGAVPRMRGGIGQFRRYDQVGAEKYFLNRNITLYISVLGSCSPLGYILHGDYEI